MKEDKLYLIHITECIDRIEQFTAEGKNTFFNDLKTQDAVIRNLQTMAESTKRLSDSLKAAYTDVDWKSMWGFRNVLVHNYLGLDLNQIWNIIEHDVGELKTKIEIILKELS